MTDKIPPHSPEAEVGVLGCIMLSPKECLSECANKLVMGGNEFYDLRHQTIYKTLLAMWGESKHIDTITLQQRLKDRKRLDQVGGIAFVAGLSDKVASASALPHYLEVVVEKAMLRETIAVCALAGDRAHGDGKPEEIIGAAERDILAIRAKRESGRGEQDIVQIQNELVADYEAAASGGKQSGVLSGFQDLDWLAGGMMPQELILISGTPSAGKTTLLCNILFHAAEHGTHSAIISLETSAKKIVHRLHCMAGRVNGGAFLRGNPAQGEHQSMVMGVKRVSAVKKHLTVRDDVYDATALLATCRQLYQKGVRLFGIDYLQKISSRVEKEYDRVTEASRVCKQIAKELNVPVIAISSLNRGDKDANKKPTMTDLRGSGNLEFDADKIYLLHCDDREAEVRPVEINVAKNKDGACGRKELTMFASQFRFESVARVGEADVPYND